MPHVAEVTSSNFEYIFSAFLEPKLKKKKKKKHVSSFIINYEQILYTNLSIKTLKLYQLHLL